jgi:hypothetical protein
MSEYDDNEMFDLARVTCEELDETCLRFADGLREDNFRDDVDADANALAGAGYGTDEDYGSFGSDEW